MHEEKETWITEYLLLLLRFGLPPLVSLLRDGQFDTLALWQRDPRFRSIADDEDVGQSEQDGNSLATISQNSFGD
jgi:hypothetical protein